MNLKFNESNFVHKVEIIFNNANNFLIVLYSLFRKAQTCMQAEDMTACPAITYLTITVEGLFPQNSR